MAKSAKRATGTRAPPKPADPCAPLRRSLDAIDNKILEDIEKLQSGDFGADERKRILRELEALNLRRQLVTRNLIACEAKRGGQGSPPAKKAKKKGR